MYALPSTWHELDWLDVNTLYYVHECLVLETFVAGCRWLRLPRDCQSSASYASLHVHQRRPHDRCFNGFSTITYPIQLNQQIKRQVQVCTFVHSVNVYVIGLRVAVDEVSAEISMVLMYMC